MSDTDASYEGVMELSSMFNPARAARREASGQAPRTGSPRASAYSRLPGTLHPINPRNISDGHDEVLLSGWGKLARWVVVAIAVIVLVVGINLILDGAEGLGGTPTSRLMDLAIHPVAGLLIGVLATALLQSSTTTTTLVVTAVGTGTVSVPVAIPMIMGANIGTTLTALVVAFSYVGGRGEFRKAFSAASIHTWFNLLCVLFILPIELMFHPLQRTSAALAEFILGRGVTTIPTNNVISGLFDPLVDLIGMNGIFGLVASRHASEILCLLFGVLLILVSIRVMSAQLSSIVAATTHSLLGGFRDDDHRHRANRRSKRTDIVGYGSGAVITTLVQASSATVSSMLAFAASGTMRLRAILPVILGANIGTTLTALLATFAVVGDHGSFALQAAMVHILFNAVGGVAVLIIPAFARGLVVLADWTGRLAQRSYGLTAAAMIAGFFVIPATILLLFAAS